MPSFIAPILRSLNRRTTLFITIALIMIFFLIDSNSTVAPPSSPFTSPGAKQNELKWKPTSCEPEAYPAGHPLRLALTPPDISPGMEAPWRADNHRQFKDLCLCLQANSCKPNQDRVVLLNSHHFKIWYHGSLDGRNGGESIWARSTLLALQGMGHTTLFGDSSAELVMMHSLIPSHVIGLIMENDRIAHCFIDTKHCSKSPANPHGIPIWKTFSFYFWMDPNHPLGEKWVLSPEDYRSEAGGKTGNTYLGYSVEPGCMKEPFIPHVDRPRGRVYAMSKRLSYFAPQDLRAWPVEFYSAAKKIQTPGGVNFVVGAHNDTDFAEEWKLEIPELPKDAITNLGLLDQKVFHKEVAKSRLLVGVGRPYTSPSPYEALCFGVPFINPILRWDTKNPNARRRWHTQHDGLKYHDPPYVYNVHKDDEKAFIAAIKNALEHPIDRYIVPRMKMSAVQERLRKLFEIDWKKEAELVLAERIQTKKGERFTI